MSITNGVYIHIPFCRKACHYCNFHFSTSLARKPQLIDCINREIELRIHEKQKTPLESIYFGGGTPSLLSKSELASILTTLSKFYIWNDTTEITLEANPEDISQEYLSDLFEVGVNRLSIGIQSFLAADLLHMNRAHTLEQSHQALECVGQSKFQNFTVDLMFGLVGSSLETWEQNIKHILNYAPPHLSIYNLTLEEQTAYFKWEQEGKLKESSHEMQQHQYQLAEDLLKSAGYEHYEVSNYALQGRSAIHNSNYWKGKPYIGFGPAAHSYDGKARTWNVSHNVKYVNAISRDEVLSETEILSPTDRFNEMIMLGLRSKHGVSELQLNEVAKEYLEHWHSASAHLFDQDILYKRNGSIQLRQSYWYVGDHIIANLFYT